MLYRQFSTQEEIDTQYDPERGVPDFRPYAEFFVGESAKARQDLKCMLDVRFGPTVEETLDIFPAADPDAPILVFIHGGYWRRLSSKEFSLVARGPVALGITTVVTNYALCPKVTLPEITRQSRAAISWLYRTEQRFAGNRKRIFVSGHSAGGHQVARLLNTPWEQDYGLPADVIKGGFAISGLFDLRPLRYSFLQPMIQLSEEIVRTESPQFNLAAGASPLITSVGGDETPEFKRQSIDYVAATKGAGNSASYSEQPGKNHFTAIEGFLDKSSALCRQVQSLIAQ
ncbi:MAG TPA: alpha/beta hydrolase [Candidatus Binataceae bacterium]|nr:alpha/beta hydrolase [Candidatus Binataceae bacterium]